MKSKFSPISYAIIFVLFAAFVMIFSSPMIVRNYKDATPNRSESAYTNSVQKSDEISQSRYIEGNEDTDIVELERRFNRRLDDIERRTNQNQIYSKQISDKYICSIEGGLNEDGVVVPIDPENPPAKFVFACEYRR